MAVSTKEVRKGTLVCLRNGWEAEVLDNATNRQTRLCKVFGTYTETGSVYSTDIVSARMPDGIWYVVEHTPAQLKAHAARKALGF